jgi:hypothetical protein
MRLRRPAARPAGACRAVFIVRRTTTSVQHLHGFYSNK